MRSLTYRIALLVFFCVGLLSVTVSATRSVGGGGRLLVALEEADMPFGSAPSPAMALDPNQSEKRTVRGGSDPIHNRS
ncbi:hypothetical protein AAHA92_31842 [Salvia divinorum]|uniref:Uncharacterized protein n=1 Tax=Salvia divinorum TaxID=28513 RepID=A0ABD1FIQ8_SALDI